MAILLILTAYSYYDLNLRNISTDDLITLCKFYKVSFDYMLYRTNDVDPYPESTIKINIEKLKSKELVEN